MSEKSEKAEKIRNTRSQVGMTLIVDPLTPLDRWLSDRIRAMLHRRTDDSTLKRLHANPMSQSDDRVQTEMAALTAVTGLSGDKANEYYHQVLDARGANDSPMSNLGNTWIPPLDKRKITPGTEDLEPIRVFDRARDPEALEKMKKVWRESREDTMPDDLASGNRSFALYPSSTYVAHPGAAEEELSHQLNYSYEVGSVARGNGSDEARDGVLAQTRKLGLGPSEAYYVFGRRDERVNAMAMAKHVVMRAKKDLVPLLAEQGGGAVDAFVAEVGREMRADGRPDNIKPVLAVVRAYAKLSRMKPSEMTPEQREAWKDLSDADVWDQVAKAEGTGDRPPAGKGVMADIKGGDVGGEVTENAEIVNSGGAADTPVTDGPRIVINPSTFRNEKDALCVAYNEAYRIIMELNGFDPTSEPTEEQRRFFADTAYADDEQMLRRTILARICTFDTSVKHPTSEQLEEAVEFLETVMEIGAPQNEEEQSIVQRTKDVLTRALEVSPEQRVEVSDAKEQPAEEQPAEEQPAEEQPAEEQPAEEQPAEEQPAEEQPAV